MALSKRGNRDGENGTHDELVAVSNPAEQSRAVDPELGGHTVDVEPLPGHEFGASDTDSTPRPWTKGFLDIQHP